MKEAQLSAVVVYDNPENREHSVKLFLSRCDFMKSIISWMSKLLFSIQGCTLDDLVWFLLLEHLKTTPPWPRERERRTISPLQPSTGQGKPVESSPFLDNGVILRKICKKKKSMDLQTLQKWGILRRICFYKISAASTALPIWWIWQGWYRGELTIFKAADYTKPGWKILLL